MAKQLDGGCLCGQLRYRCHAPPEWLIVCYCSFCQRATGSDRMVEPLFHPDVFEVVAGTPKVFDLPSAGSGKTIHVHFCPDCGTKIALTFERFPDSLGLYAGTLDDPSMIDITPDAGWQIFVSEARADTLIYPGIPTYLRYSKDNDDEPQPDLIPAAPMRADTFLAEFHAHHPVLPDASSR
jgi:hypothetical protein